MSTNNYLTVLQLDEFGEVRLLGPDKLSAAEERLTCHLPGLLLMLLSVWRRFEIIVWRIRVVIGWVRDVVLIRLGFFLIIISQPESLTQAGSSIDKGSGEGGIGVRFIVGEVVLFGREPNLIGGRVQGFLGVAKGEGGLGLVGLPALPHLGDAPELVQLHGERLVGHV